MRVLLAVFACLFVAAFADPTLTFTWLEEGCSGTANAVAGADIGACSAESCVSAGGASVRIECPDTLSMPAAYSGVVSYTAEDCAAADVSTVAGFGNGCVEVTAGVYQEMDCQGDTVIYKTACSDDMCDTGCVTANVTACVNLAGTSVGYVCGSGAAAIAAPLMLVIACLAVFLF